MSLTHTDSSPINPASGSTASAKRRAILNVATGHYTQYQDRLLKSLDVVSNNIPVLVWRNGFPPESPTHHEANYVFKLYAIREALKQGYNSIMWVDSGVWFIRHPRLIFERFEEEGHAFWIGGDKLGEWSNDHSLEVFKETRDNVLERNWQLVSGTMYGFDFTHEKTRLFFDQWFEHWKKGTFMGHYLNQGGDSASLTGSGAHNKSVGFVSNDPRCKGHRMDETVASFLAYHMGLKMTNLGDLFQGYQRDDKPDATARSGY